MITILPTYSGETGIGQTLPFQNGEIQGKGVGSPASPIYSNTNVIIRQSSTVINPLWFGGLPYRPARAVLSSLWLCWGTLHPQVCGFPGPMTLQDGLIPTSLVERLSNLLKPRWWSGQSLNCLWGPSSPFLKESASSCPNNTMTQSYRI